MQLYETDKADRVQAFKNELKSYKQLKRDYRYYSEQCMFYQNKLYNCGSPDLSNDIRIYYDPMKPDPRFDSQTTKDFFATVQNKMHYAVHGGTAAGREGPSFEKVKINCISFL